MSAAISMDQIFKVANEIAKSGEMPTVAQVRAGLGNKGSASTIHKYLSDWKYRLLQNADLIDHKDQSYKKENLILRDNLSKLQISTQALNIELSETEDRERLLLNENQQLLQTKHLLEAEITTLNAQKSSLSMVLDELKNEREVLLASILTDKNAHIVKLEDELKKLHSYYLEAMREQNTKAHDILMDEKVKIINLQHEVDRLRKELEAERGSVCMK